MILEAIKKAALDTWDELLYLVLLNIIWCVGTLLVIPWPLVTFGLFFTVHDITEGKSVKIRTFIGHARRTWKEAYIWGGVNVAVLAVLGANLAFYGRIAVQWAATLQLLMIALIGLWIILQLVTLPLYPHLEQPGLTIALRNALILIGRYPVVTLVLIIFIGLLALISNLLPAAAFLITFVLIAMLASWLVKLMVRRELKRGS